MLATYPVELLSKLAQLVNENCNAAPLHRGLAPDRKTTELYDFCRYGAQSKRTMGIKVLGFRRINHWTTLWSVGVWVLQENLYSVGPVKFCGMQSMFYSVERTWDADQQ